MAQNVTIAGASYLGVPRIEMPKTGGGTAVFVDTSDANAAAGDITKGKTAYVGGTKITGTLEASSVSVQDAKALTITSNGTVSVTPDAPYDALKKVDVTVNVASGGGGFNVSISIQRVYTGDTLVTGVLGKARPFNYAEGTLFAQEKMSEGGVVYTGAIVTGSYAYEYIENLVNVDVYIYTISKGWVKQEITSFPYRFSGDVNAAIYIPVANNAIINTSYYE